MTVAVRARHGIVVALATGLLALPVAVAAASGEVNLLKVLAAPLAKAERGKLPVLVPGRLDAADFSSDRLYAAGGLSGGGYDIQLGAAPNCDDSPACFVAEFSATKSKSVSGGSRVSLDKGLTGRYTTVACGASCGPASVQWLEYGARYTVWFGAGKSELVALADAAISAGPR
jgi:hypothetical protein